MGWGDTQSNLTGFEARGRRHKRWRKPLEGGRVRETNSSLEPPERNQPCQGVIVYQNNPHKTSDLQNWNILTVCFRSL
jgi:hypothetical protein